MVYVDESWFTNDMPRPNGYASIGERCTGKRDWHSKGRTNAIGALLGVFLITVTLVVGSKNANVFFAWIIQYLLPKLTIKSVIVVDNASLHKRSDIQQAIEDAGHILEYLPP